MLSLVGWYAHTFPLVLLWIHPNFWRHALLKKLGSQPVPRVYSLVARGGHCLREQKEIPVLVFERDDKPLGGRNRSGTCPLRRLRIPA